MTFVMLLLRQMVSLLPVLLSIILLVHLQTRFKDYRAIIVILFLLTIPAVIKNNLWWHPDGLSTFFALLTIFFLNRDNLTFGRNYYYAAIACGISAGIKGVGFFFFLTIIVYLSIGLYTKTIDFRKSVVSALGFLLCMAGSFLIVNPTLIYSGPRELYIRDTIETAQRLSQGYTVSYAKGIQAAIPQMEGDYADSLIIIILFTSCIWGMMQGSRRLLHTIILTWSIPITIMVLFTIHYKHQYWLPVSLPLFSTIVNLLPEKIDFRSIFSNKKITTWLAILFIGMLFMQFYINQQKDIKIFSQTLNREENSPSIRFYDRVVEIMDHLPQDRTYHILQDARMYIPPRENWYSEAIFDLLNYNIIQEKNFHVLLILQQRIYDYLESSVVGLDKTSFAENQAFYRDAKMGEIKGYQLVYSDSFGLIFINEKTYVEYFDQVIKTKQLN